MHVNLDLSVLQHQVHSGKSQVIYQHQMKKSSHAGFIRIWKNKIVQPKNQSI